MNQWGVAVLELDSHPDQNMGPDHAPCACPKTHPIDQRLLPYYIADNQPIDNTTFVLKSKLNQPLNRLSSPFEKLYLVFRIVIGYLSL